LTGHLEDFLEDFLTGLADDFLTTEETRFLVGFKLFLQLLVIILPKTALVALAGAGLPDIFFTSFFKDGLSMVERELYRLVLVLRTLIGILYNNEIEKKIKKLKKRQEPM
jgi:hypothetical protein